MAWARLDDNLHDHPKVMELSLPAIGLWTVCLTWAHRNIRQSRHPGHLTPATVRRFAGAKAARLGAELVAAGMWEVADDGWAIHDFADYIAPDRERTTPGTSPELSEKRRTAGSKGGKAAQQNKQKERATEQVAGEQTRQVLVSPVVASNEATPEPDPEKTSAPTVLPATADPPTVNQRANAIANAYCQTVPLSNHPAVAGILRKAIGTGQYSDEDIRCAVFRLAQDRRPVTVDTLRIELEGLPAPSRVNGRQAETDAQFARQMARAQAQMEAP